MKTVKSKAELTKLAVSRGVTVKLANGGLVNAAGVRATGVTKQAPKEAPPVPAAAPAPASVDLKPLADMLAQLMAQLAERPEVEAPQVVVQAPAPRPPQAYEFKVIRGENGYIKSIIATPI